jgi:hypothetical protein
LGVDLAVEVAGAFAAVVVAVAGSPLPVGSLRTKSKIISLDSSGSSGSHAPSALKSGASSGSPGDDQHMSGKEEELAVNDSDWSETRLPAAFFDNFFESRPAEPTQALVDAARRLRAVVQRS